LSLSFGDYVTIVQSNGVWYFGFKSNVQGPLHQYHKRFFVEGEKKQQQKPEMGIFPSSFVFVRDHLLLSSDAKETQQFEDVQKVVRNAWRWKIILKELYEVTTQEKFCIFWCCCFSITSSFVLPFRLSPSFFVDFFFGFKFVVRLFFFSLVSSFQRRDMKGYLFLKDQIISLLEHHDELQREVPVIEGENRAETAIFLHKSTYFLTSHCSPLLFS